MAGGEEMAEQGRLAALERLHEKRPAHLFDVAIGLLAERVLERQAFREPRVDLVRVHMLAQHNLDFLDPGKRANRPAHIVGHQKREVRRAPIGWQSEPDVNAIVRVHVGFRDEVQLRHRLVQLRIHHAVQTGPYLPSTGLQFVVRPCCVKTHPRHSAAWADAAR